MALEPTEGASTSRAGRWSAILLLPALFLCSEARAGARAGAQLIPAYFTGDFGSGVETDIFYVPFIFSVTSNRQEFRLTAPFLQVRTDEPVTFVGGDVIRRGIGGKTTESGPGDVILKEEVFFLQGDGRRRPWVSGIARVKFPTADEEKGLGTGELDYGPGVGLIQPLGPRWNLLAEFLYVVRGDPPEADFRNTVWSSVGIQRHQGAASVYLYYDSRQSVLRGRTAIRDLIVGFDHRLSPAITFRSALFVGLSDTAEDHGISMGLSAKTPR